MILKVEYKSEAQILGIKKVLSEMYGCRIRPRGRHSDRKRVLGNNWRKWTQNDIPWRKAETVAFYIRTS